MEKLYGELILCIIITLWASRLIFPFMFQYDVQILTLSHKPSCFFTFVCFSGNESPLITEQFKL